MDTQDPQQPQPPPEDRTDPPAAPAGPDADADFAPYPLPLPYPPDEVRLDANVLQHVLRGRRFKLSGNRCGYVTERAVYPCFDGHDRFDDEDAWEDEYGGPWFGRNWQDVRDAERILRSVGPRAYRAYAAALVQEVEPDWRDLHDEDDVTGFWYRLATARPRQRRAAMARIARRMPRLWAGVDMRMRIPAQPHTFTYDERQRELLARAAELALHARYVGEASKDDDPWGLLDVDVPDHRGGERQETLGSYCRMLTSLERRWLGAMVVYGMGKGTSVREVLARQWPVMGNRATLLNVLLSLKGRRDRYALERAKEQLDDDPARAIGIEAL